MLKQKVVYRVTHANAKGVLKVVRVFKGATQFEIEKKIVATRQAMLKASYVVKGVKKYAIEEV